jgi:hypothetical protein
VRQLSKNQSLLHGRRRRRPHLLHQLEIALQKDGLHLAQVIRAALLVVGGALVLAVDCLLLVDLVGVQAEQMHCQHARLGRVEHSDDLAAETGLVLQFCLQKAQVGVLTGLPALVHLPKQLNALRVVVVRRKLDYVAQGLQQILRVCGALTCEISLSNTKSRYASFPSIALMWSSY